MCSSPRGSVRSPLGQCRDDGERGRASGSPRPVDGKEAASVAASEHSAAQSEGAGESVLERMEDSVEAPSSGEARKAAETVGESASSVAAVSLGEYMKTSATQTARPAKTETAGESPLGSSGRGLVSVSGEGKRRREGEGGGSVSAFERAVKLLHPQQLRLLASSLPLAAVQEASTEGPSKRRPQIVLSEDRWEAALEHIVRRDFFPDIPLLRLVHRLLHAERRRDASAVNALAAEIKALAPATPMHLPSLKRQRQEEERRRHADKQQESHSGAEEEDFPQTPITSTAAAAESLCVSSRVFPFAEENASGRQETVAVPAGAEAPLHLALDQFLEVATSEDRRSVQSLLDRESSARRERREALWSEQRDHNARQLALLGSTAAGEKANRVAVNFHPGETSLFFRGAGDAGGPNVLPREDIRAERTRFTTLQRQMQLQQLHAQLRARQEQQRGQKAVYEVVQKGEFRPPAEKEASTEGLATEGFGAVPLSVPVASADGKDGEPATWGSLLGTPVLLHVEQSTPVIAKALAAASAEEAEPLPAEVPAFEIPAPRRREAAAAKLHQQVADKAQRREQRKKLRRMGSAAAVAARVAREALGLSSAGSRSAGGNSSNGSAVFAAASSALQLQMRLHAQSGKGSAGSGEASSSGRSSGSGFGFLRDEMLRSPLVKAISEKRRAEGTVDLQLRAAYSSRKSCE